MLRWKKEDLSAKSEQSTIAFTRTNMVGVCTVPFFCCVPLSYCRPAHAVVFLMHPVFMARHLVLPLLSTLPPGLFDTLRSDTHSELALCFVFDFPFARLYRNIPREPKRHVLVYYSCEVEFLLSLSSKPSFESYHITSCVWFIIL